MINHDELQDPLKPLSLFYELDEWQVSFVETLEEHHESLEDIILIEVVSLDVRQLFEVAKNLSIHGLYTFPPSVGVDCFLSFENGFARALSRWKTYR